MQYYENAVSNASSGLPVSGASVLVQNFPSGTTATIYATNSLTNVSTNPLTTSATGAFGFFAKNGLYQLVINGGTAIGPFLFNDVTDTDGSISNTWAVPGSIGATTPNAGNFTSISKNGVEIFTLLAPLASPTFTGTPSAPTASTGATGTQLATLDFVNNSILIASSEVAGSFRNLQIQAVGLTNTSVVILADKVTLRDVNGNTVGVSNINFTISNIASGVNGLDTGTVASNTWYSVWVIYNKTTGTAAGIISTSSTSPTLPAGYTFFARFGWVRTDGSVNKYFLQTRQWGRKAQYVITASSNVPNMPVIASGAAGVVGTTGATTWVAYPLTNFVPTSACGINLAIHTAYNNAANSNVQVAPNLSYSGMFTTNPAPFQASVGNSVTVIYPGTMMFDGGLQIYYAASAAGGAAMCFGWEDNL